MGAAIVGSRTGKGVWSALGGVMPVKASLRRQKCHVQSKVSGEPCKICNPHRQIFPESSIVPHCTRNKIARGLGGRYECYRHSPPKLLPKDLDPRVEDP